MNCPPVWNEATDSLQELSLFLLERMMPFLPELQAQIGQGWEPLTRFLFAEERRLRAELDLLASHAAGGRIHVERLSPAKAYFLMLRAQCGCDFAGQVYPPASKEDPFALPSGWSATKLRRWLLTELWTRRGDSWLKLVALELTGPFPFYGIEPAPEFG